MALKKWLILLIFVGQLMGSALAASSFQPAKVPNSIELSCIEPNSTLNNAPAIDGELFRAEMLKLPLSFIENRGQASDDAKFMVKTSHEAIYFTPSGVLFALSSENNTSIVGMSFENAGPNRLSGEDVLPGTANFFIGNNSSQWITDISTYSSIKYESLYPGIDLIFKGTDGNLKHELLLKPGADPAKIVLTYSGQDSLSLDKNGSILIKTAAGNLTDSAPFCYQDINGSRLAVDGKYRRIDDKRIGFDLNNYDRSLPLVIDPLLRYSTYLGGRETDDGYSIAVDSSGNAYITGDTNSTDFPTENAYQAANAGGRDAFIVKLNPAGNKLVYSTYLGGSDNDIGWGIAIDRSGNAYITGWTNSTDLPIKNAYQSAIAGERSAFISKLSPAGNKLVYSTYLGGSGDDNAGWSIAIDRDGNAFVTGWTNSTDFPTKNAYQSAIAGVRDAFIAKLSPAGNKLVYSTYLGGSKFDEGHGIAVDSSGNAYVTGETGSINFPTENAYQAANAGERDAFVAKLSPAGNKLVYSTYLGGSRGDEGTGIAVDRSCNAYVAGGTGSVNFPTENAYQLSNAGCSDVFVTKLNPAGNKLVYSTYLGGNSCENGNGIAIDSSGNAYVTGETPSTNFPIKNAYQGTFAGYYDAFVTKLSPAGNKLIYSTYLGGSGPDWGTGVALDQGGNAYVAGWTNSTDFPTKNAYQPANAGDYNAFITVFIKAPPNTPSKPSGAISGKKGIFYRYTTSATDPEGDRIKYTFNWGDGTTSTTRPVNSGTEVIASHKWTKTGTFLVKARATDSKGASSGYSSPLEVKISGGRSAPIAIITN